MTIGIEGHTLIAAICRSCAEIRRFEITTPVVTLLVTVGVSGNKKPGVKRMITDQQLVRVTTIHGSKAFPQSISTSLLPIVTNSFDGQLVFRLKWALSPVWWSTKIISVNWSKGKSKTTVVIYWTRSNGSKLCVGASEMITVGWCTRQGLKLWKTLIIQTTEFFLTRNLECIIVYKLKRKTAKA